MTRDCALAFVDVSKSFGASRVLTDVNLQVEAGCIHALLGENGAGKSTMMRIASGALKPDEGHVLVGRERVTQDPRAARRLGLRIVYQERQIAAELNVTENVLLGQLRAGLVRRRAAEAEARRRLSLLGVDLEVDRLAGELSVAEMQLVELARAMSAEAQVLLLDEPTASLHVHEVESLLAVVRRLAEQGLAVVWISHHLHEVFELAERATILRDGRVVDTVEISDASPGDVLRLMFGESVSLQRERRVGDVQLEARPTAIRADRVSVERLLHDVSIDVRRGEIVALAGAEGSGIHTLADVLSGAQRPTSGQVVLDSANKELRSRRDGARRGVGFLPRDRKRRGILPGRSIAENVILARVALSRSPAVANRRLRARARAVADSVGVTMSDERAPIDTLSGGNQQKVMLARWLDVASAVLIFDEPTAGVDLASRFELYEQIALLARGGTGVVIASDDFEEISLLADRVLIMHRGSIVAELASEEATPERLRELTLAGT